MLAPPRPAEAVVVRRRAGPGPGKQAQRRRATCKCSACNGGASGNLLHHDDVGAKGAVQAVPATMALARVLNDDVAKQLDSAFFGVDWHYASVEDLEERFQTDLQRGMSMSVASDKIETSGPNLIPSPQPCPAWMCCLLPWLRNTPAMQAYRRCIADTAQVMRGGRCICVDPVSLIQGDIVYIEENEVVPADCRILSCSDDLSVYAFDMEEVALPGSATLGNPRDSFLESRNILYAGSQLVAGHARAVVINTGRATVMGALIKRGFWPPSAHARTGDELPLLPL